MTSWDGSRLIPDDSGRFYESYFQRANHPTRPLAFWIRYTAFSPRSRPDSARGELWAIFFDGEQRRIAAARESVPIARCRFSPVSMDVRIGDATLTRGALQGEARSAHHLNWSLRCTADKPPLLLLPESYYTRALPRAKALVSAPFAAFTGVLTVDGTPIAIDGWVGSQNHNWGDRHTDSYAWGQVAGFDNAPDVFLECATAQVRIGSLWTPRLTLAVVRDEDGEVALNGVLQAVRARGRFDFFTWTIDTKGRGDRICGTIRSAANVFAGLAYDNPPGGSKTCLNTKLAGADITLHRRGRPPRRLVTAHRAAFEILTDRTDHGVPVVA